MHINCYNNKELFMYIKFKELNDTDSVTVNSEKFSYFQYFTGKVEIIIEFIFVSYPLKIPYL